MGKGDSPLRWVRREIFGATQDEMAAVAGVSRPRISRYETSDAPPYEVLQRIRAAAIERGFVFSGDWFFEIPSDEQEAA